MSKSVWVFVKGLIDSQGHMWPRHFGALDVTEVIDFQSVGKNYNLSQTGYEELIDKAQSYWDKKFRGNNPRRQLSVPERHQLRIAYDTLRMSDAMVGVMGGPNKEQARRIIYELTGKRPRENPKRRYSTMARKKGLLSTKIMGLSLPVIAISGFILYKIFKKPV